MLTLKYRKGGVDTAYITRPSTKWTIITGRGAVVRQWGNKFIGMSMVFNFTNIGHEDTLAIHNIKWRVRTFFGLRL